MPAKQIVSLKQRCDSVRDGFHMLERTNISAAGLAFQILAVASFILGVLSFLILFPGDSFPPQRLLKRRRGTFTFVALQWAILIPFLVLHVHLNRIRGLPSGAELGQTVKDCGISKLPRVLAEKDGAALRILDTPNGPLSLILVCFATCLAVFLTLKLVRSVTFEKPHFELPLGNSFGSSMWYNSDHKRTNYIQTPSTFILHPRRPQKVAVSRNIHWSDSGELRDQFWSDDED